MTAGARSARDAAVERRPALHPRLERLRDAGVSIWLDTLSRDLLDSGHFERLVRDLGVTGATSNPTIFERAIGSSERYDQQLRELGTIEPREAFLALALEDVRRAADLLRPAHAASGGSDGFVSFECTPDVAHDTGATVKQALELWSRLDRPNVMIKVPATAAGVPAVEELTGAGVNVNVTLLFSVDRYDQIVEAYLRGLETRAARGERLERISSVASFFLSRVDVKADVLLPPGSRLHGRVAIANALRAYRLFQERFRGPRWERLRRLGARAQRPLWASTATKSPHLSDVLYVEGLVTPGAINTMTEPTLRAFADHGEVRISAQSAKPELDLRAIALELEREGVEAFCTSYSALLERIESKSARISRTLDPRRTT